MTSSCKLLQRIWKSIWFEWYKEKYLGSNSGSEFLYNDD